MMQAVFAIGLGLVMLVWAASVYPKLWRIMIEQPADILNRLTLKKALLGLALILAVLVFAQTAPADIALLLASDVLTYIEIAAALWLAAANAQSRMAFRRIVRQALRQARKWRSFSRATVTAMKRVARQRALSIRKGIARLSPPADDAEPWAASFG